MMVTKYQKVMNDIKNDVISGIYAVGNQLPSEVELQEKYKVSRVTLRRAVDQLVKDGYVKKVQGKGTYVRNFKKIKRLIRHASIESFSKIVIENEMTPKTKVLSIKECKFQLDISNYNGLTEQAINVWRLRYADNVPVTIENNYFPSPRFKKILEMDMSQSLYNLFYLQFGIKSLHTKKATISIVASSYELAQLLDCSVGFPLFLLETIITDDCGNVVQVAEEYIMSNRYQFEL